MRSCLGGALLLVALVVAGAAQAEKPIIYPAKGQTPQQQEKDEGECQVWAQKNTGVDPAALAATPVQAPGGQAAYGGHYRARGAARGALGGAAIGAAAGDAGAGAAAGAIAGTMLGGRRSRMAQAESAQRAQAAQSQREQQINTYYRALSACMVGRGYTVQ